jgi:hypothetical protein
MTAFGSTDTNGSTKKTPTQNPQQPSSPNNYMASSYRTVNIKLITITVDGSTYISYVDLQSRGASIPLYKGYSSCCSSDIQNTAGLWNPYASLDRKAMQ